MEMKQPVSVDFVTVLHMCTSCRFLSFSVYLTIFV